MITIEAGGAGTASATDCGPLSFVCDTVGGVIGNSVVGPGVEFVNVVFDILVKAFSDELASAVTKLLVELATSWLDAKHTDVQAPNGPVDQLRSHTSVLTAGIAVGALLVTATRMILNRNGRDFRVMVRGLIWLVIVTTASISGMALLLRIGDSYSSWIIRASTGGDAEARLKELVEQVIVLGPASRLLVIVLLGVTFIGGLGQILVFLGRDVGIVLTAGLAPTAAAAALTERGEHTRGRAFAWGLTFLGYKPAAATVYAGDFWMIGSGNDHTVTTALAGVVGLIMASLTMPALIRLIAPVMIGASSSWSSGRLTAGTGKAQSVATGALKTAVFGRPSGGGAGGGGGGGYGGRSSILSRILLGRPRASTGGVPTRADRVITRIGGAATVVVAAAYIATAAVANTTKKIGRTAASGIDENG
jgi:hypothetical protein